MDGVQPERRLSFLESRATEEEDDVEEEGEWLAAFFFKAFLRVVGTV